MKTTIYEKYLECYISNDQECFEDGAGYGCGINEEKCQALKGRYLPYSRLGIVEDLPAFYFCGS